MSTELDRIGHLWKQAEEAHRAFVQFVGIAIGWESDIFTNIINLP